MVRAVGEPSAQRRSCPARSLRPASVDSDRLISIADVRRALGSAGPRPFGLGTTAGLPRTRSDLTALLTVVGQRSRPLNSLRRKPPGQSARKWAGSSGRANLRSPATPPRRITERSVLPAHAGEALHHTLSCAGCPTRCQVVM